MQKTKKDARRRPAEGDSAWELALGPVIVFTSVWILWILATIGKVGVL